MSGERPVIAPPGDDELRAMLEGRAVRMTSADAREVLAAARAEIAGPGAAYGSEVGERDGWTSGVRPVRLEPRVTGRESRMPWRLAVLGVTAVVAVAVLGSRLAVGPTDVVPGASPTASEVASPDPFTPMPSMASPAPIAILTAGQLAAGLADGSLDGSTVLVDAQLVTDPVPCPSATEDCFELHIEGPVSVPVTRVVTYDAYTRNAGAGMPVAVSIAAGRVTLLGWVVAGVDAPRTAADLASRDAPMPAGDLVVVDGWLTPAQGDVSCLLPARVGCDGSRPRLTNASPFIDGTWTDGVPGIDASIPAAFGLNEDKEFMVGRFLVGAGPLQRGGNPPAYAVVATLDAEVQRVDQQVTSMDPVPSPSPSIAPVGERMSAAGFERALRLGKLEGRVVELEGRMRLAAGRCRGTSEDCTWLQLEGLDGVFIDKGDLSVDEAAAAIRRHPNAGPIALRVSGAGAGLIGWISAGASTPVDGAALRAGDLPLDPGDVGVVAGWLLGAPASPPCSATPETCAMWPMLSPSEPIPGVELYGDTGVPVMVAESLGLPPAPAAMKGPFVVAAWRAPSTGEPGFEVVDRFTDVLAVDPASTPVPTASPSPGVAEPTVVCQPNPSIRAQTDANGSPLPIAAFVTLTCENAVAAAKAIAGPQPATTYIEFAYGYWCPIGSACALAMPNTGHVVFHRKGLLPDLLVGVTADETGKVTATVPMPVPSPSPSD